MTLTLALHDDGAVSCAAVPWRFRGRHQVTIVVKTTFAIVPNGVATVLPPEPVQLTDKHYSDDPRRSLELASEIAPFLRRCDVLFTGHAYAAGSATRAAVRLGVAGGERALLDKTIHIFGDRATPDALPTPFERLPIVYERAFGGLGAPNPVGKAIPNLVDPGDARRPAALGPVLRWWPARRQLLGGLDARAIDAALPLGRVPTIDLPDATPWEYFQAAPPDQQIDYLRGDEWLVVDGVHAKLPRLQTKLPGLRGAARVVDASLALSGFGDRPRLVCDRVAIDGDRLTVTLLWRGQLDVEEAASSSRPLVAMAALESPGSPIDWTRILNRGPSPVAPRDVEGATNLGKTASVDPQRASSSALPFDLKVPAAEVLARMPVSRGEPARAPRGDRRTVALRQEDVLRMRGPLPFAAPQEVPQVAPPSPRPTTPSQDDLQAPVPPHPAPPVSGFETSSSDLPASMSRPSGATQGVSLETVPDPAIGKVVSTAAPGEVTLRECGALAASMARRSDERAQILEARGMTEETWRVLDESWAARIQAEVEKGKAALLSEYDAGYVAQLVSERGPITAEDYARILVAVERRSADAVMLGMGLPVEATARIRRVWIARMATDVEQGALVRKAIEAERAR